MKPSLLFSLFVLSAFGSASANAVNGVRNEVEQAPKLAKPEKAAPEMPSLAPAPTEQERYSLAELQTNPTLTHQLLVQAIYAQNVMWIERLLGIYQTFPQQDATLVQFSQAKIAALREDYPTAVRIYREMLANQPQLNPVRIELAIALFRQKQDNAAKSQFQRAKSVENLQPAVVELIDAYLSALEERDGWNVDFSVQYLRDKNVNNTADSREIEQTGFVKGAQMLPQKAHGLGYNLGISRDFNVIHSHYLTLSNDLNGKSYWDKHDYDELTNRTALGYSYKNHQQTLRVLPFYEKRWYGGEKERQTRGVRLEYNRWLSANWQFSSAAEWSKARYFEGTAQNGNNKLFSNTLVWVRNPKQYFYFGADLNVERTRVKQYSNDSKSVRVGWGQEWGKGISTSLSYSLTLRDFKDQARLGGILSLGKVREDKIHSVNAKIWKRDWHIFGITPKLTYQWRKQNSNIPTMYSYTEKNVNVVFEKSF